MNADDVAAVKTAVTNILSDPENADALKFAPLGTQKATAFIFSLLEAATSIRVSEFPLYLMWSKFPEGDDEYDFLSINEAGILYDSGWKKVAFGNIVFESSLKFRPMTEEEKVKISEIADEYSGRK